MTVPPKPAPGPNIAEVFGRIARMAQPTWTKFLVFAILGLACGSAIVLIDTTIERNLRNFATYGGAGAGITVFYFFAFGGMAGYFSRMAATIRQQTTIQEKTEGLQAAIEEDFFNNLVKINFKYIDKYYLQTQIQADKSFWITCVAAIVGFLVMIAGIILMYFGKTEAGYVSAGSGIISQFISGVFFYLYNKTIVAMAGYHRKLVLTQNIGLALRITQDLPDPQRVAARQQLIDRLSADINNLLAADGDDGA